MINVQFCGQFGNQNHQYLTGKIIAARTGLHYQPPDTFFKKNGDPVQWSGEPLFTMQPTPGFILQADANGWQMIDGMHWLDLNSIKGDKPVSLRGFWQRYELIQPYKDQIKNEWLHIPAHRFVEVPNDALVVHVRRTDYCVIDHKGTPPDTQRQERATTLDEYARCLQEFPEARRLVLVTDDPDDPFLLGFNRFGLPVTVQSYAWDRDFLTLASARWLVISCSTFSWWAGWLGRAERICVPCFLGTYWHNGLGARGPDRPDFPNLYPEDEGDRWRWLTS